MKPVDVLLCLRSSPLDELPLPCMLPPAADLMNLTGLGWKPILGLVIATLVVAILAFAIVYGICRGLAESGVSPQKLLLYIREITIVIAACILGVAVCILIAFVMPHLATLVGILAAVLLVALGVATSLFLAILLYSMLMSGNE